VLIPFEYDELLARIRKVLKQEERIRKVPERINKGGLSLDPISLQAFLHGEDLLLTQKEFTLLLLFTQHENRIISPEYLYEKVWGREMSESENAVKVTISKLRKKMGETEYKITAEYGEGYRFERAEKAKG